jgi:hypothetical protein
MYLSIDQKKIEVWKNIVLPSTRALLVSSVVNTVYSGGIIHSGLRYQFAVVSLITMVSLAG